MYRILIVEDDPGIAEGLRQLMENWGLEAFVARNFQDILGEFRACQPHLVLLDISLPAEGYHVFGAENGLQALEILRREQVHLVLLDISLPFFNGYYWCGELRKLSRVPILFLSSSGDNMSIVMAVNLGADDFIAKPFDQRVLMAKLQALLRRTYDFSAAAPVLEHRGALLNTGDQTLTFQGERIALTRNEYRILLCLMESRGKVVSREKLMQRLWETDSFVDENTLTVNVNRLRKKLDAAGLTGFITTRVGVGYQVE